MPERTRRKHPLDGVQAKEVNWTPIAAMLENAVMRPRLPFVYFIGEYPDGPLKIGTAAEPIKRRRQLQTGNPRALRIEQLIYGERQVEALMHRTFSQYVMRSTKERRTQIDGPIRLDTEWFTPEARGLILNGAAIIAEQQIAAVGATDLELGQIVLEGLASLSTGRTELDNVRLLAQGIGYAEKRRHVP